MLTLLTLKSPKSGTIAEVFFRTGQVISTGDTVLTLDSFREDKALGKLSSARTTVTATIESLSEAVENGKIQSLSAAAESRRSAALAAEVILAMTKEEAKVGQKTTLDVLDAQANLYAAKSLSRNSPQGLEILKIERI